jgi:hypothetical protein
MAVNLKQISLAFVCMTLLFGTSTWPQLKPLYALQSSDQSAAKLLASSGPSPFFLPPSSSSNSQGNVPNSTTGPATNSTTGPATNSTTGPATNSTTGPATNSTTGPATGVKFQPYENSTYGIKIQYPSNWIKQENHNLTSAGRIVKFNSQGAHSATFNIIGGNRLPSNMSLEQFSVTSINNLRQSFPHFNLLESNSTTLGGFPAHRVIYTAEVAPGIRIKSMQVWTVKDSRDFIITYLSLPNDFPNYFSTIQHMIESFAFIPLPAAPQPANNTTTPAANTTTPAANTTTPAANTTTPAANRTTTPTTIHFLPYQNLTAGFKIKYPSYWQKSENISANGSIVYFQEPVLDARFIVLSHKLPQGYPSNESKSLFFSAMLNAFTQQLQSYNPIRSISTTIAGSPANKTEFTFMSNGQQAEGIVLFSIIGNKFYLLSYGAAKYSYPVLLPSAQAMIDSFLPIKETTSAANLSINSNPASNTTAPATNATTPATSFHSSFDTFVVPGSVNGNGVYQAHNSSIFKSGEKILL